MRRYRCEARIKKEARSLTLRSRVEQRRGQSAIGVRLTMMRLIRLRRNVARYDKNNRPVIDYNFLARAS